MKVLLLLVPLSLTVAACSTSSEAEPAIRPLAEATTSSTSTPSTTTAPMTTTTAEPDPWARPANPDAAYFERVLNELEEINVEAFRLVRDDGALGERAESLLRSTKTGLNLEFSLGQALSFAGEFPPQLTLERAPLLAEVQVLQTTESCALVASSVSFSGVYSAERDGERAVIRLVATDTNATGWSTEQRWELGTEPELSCTG